MRRLQALAGHLAPTSLNRDQSPGGTHNGHKKKAPLTRERDGAFRRGKKPGVISLRPLRPTSGMITLFIRPCRSEVPHDPHYYQLLSTGHPPNLSPVLEYCIRCTGKSQHKIRVFTGPGGPGQHFENPQASHATQPSLKRSCPWQSGQTTLYIACCHWIPRASPRKLALFRPPPLPLVRVAVVTSAAPPLPLPPGD